MPQRKKNARYVNIYLELTLADTLDRYSEDSGVPKTRVVEKALAEYFVKHKITVRKTTKREKAQKAMTVAERLMEEADEQEEEQ